MSCQACRLSKVKCDVSERPPGVACSRCARIGLECSVPASKRGKPSINRTISKLGPKVRELLSSAIWRRPSTTPTPPAEADGVTRTELQQLVKDTWRTQRKDFLITWAQIAKMNNSHKLMESVLSLAQTLANVSVADVTMPPSSAAERRRPEPPQHECPAAVAAMVNSSGYCFARCCTAPASGESNIFLTNRSFDEAVGDAQQLEAAWLSSGFGDIAPAAASSLAVVGLFLHDADVVPLAFLIDNLVERLTSGGGGSSTSSSSSVASAAASLVPSTPSPAPPSLIGQLLCDESAASMRVLDRRVGPHAYVECTCVPYVFIAEGGVIWIGGRFEPQPLPGPNPNPKPNPNPNPKPNRFEPQPLPAELPCAVAVAAAIADGHSMDGRCDLAASTERSSAAEPCAPPPPAAATPPPPPFPPAPAQASPPYVVWHVAEAGRGGAQPPPAAQAELSLGPGFDALPPPAPADEEIGSFLNLPLDDLLFGGGAFSHHGH